MSDNRSKYPELYAFFQERRLEFMLDQAGFVPRQNGVGFYFPTFDGEGKPYGWKATYNIREPERREHGKVNLGGKPSHIHYYMLGKTAEAIKAADGKCFVLSGVTDLLSVRAAGINNSLGLIAGEIAIPKTFAQDLLELGAREVIYYPDLDATGARSVAKLHLLCRNTPLVFKPKTLPLIGGKDTNDLLVQAFMLEGEDHEKALALFYRAFFNATDMEIPIPKIPPNVELPRLKAARNFKLQDDVFTEACQKLGIKGFNSKGISNTIHCPFHEDEHPSAVLFENVDSGLPLLFCFCCDSKLFRDVCAQIGVPWRLKETLFKEEEDIDFEHLPPNQELLFAAAELIADLPPEVIARNPLLLPAIVSEGGFPHALRMRMLQKKQARLVRFLEILHLKEVEPGLFYTAKELLERLDGFYINSNAIRNMMNFFVSKHPQLFLKRERGIRKTAKHKLPLEYYIPTLEQLRVYYNLKTRDMAERVNVAEENLKKLRNYRASIHRLIVERYAPIWAETGNYPSTKKLAKGLGVSPKTIWDYERDSPIVRIRRILERPVEDDFTLTPEDNKHGMYIVERGKQKYLVMHQTSARVINYVLLRYLEEQTRLKMEAAAKIAAQEAESADGEEEDIPTPTEVVATDDPKIAEVGIFCRQCGQMALIVPQPSDACPHCGLQRGWQNEPPTVMLDDMLRYSKNGLQAKPKRKQRRTTPRTWEDSMKRSGGEGRPTLMDLIHDISEGKELDPPKAIISRGSHYEEKLDFMFDDDEDEDMDEKFSGDTNDIPF